MNPSNLFVMDGKKTILFAAVLAATAILPALYMADPASASMLMSQCQRKHSLCTERCIINSGSGKKGVDQANACISRTCDKQNPGCGPSSLGKKGGGGKLIQTTPTGNSKASGVLVPRGTGVLSNQTQPSNQLPANLRPRTPLMGSGIFIR